MKDYIVKTKRSLLAEWNRRILSIVNVTVFGLFIYWIVWKHGSRGRIAKDDNFKETENITPSKDKGFHWTEAVFENEFCNLKI